MRVMTVVGTRPELIKMSRVIAELDKCFDHTLVHTGQNFDYELNEIFLRDLNIRKPDHFLGCAAETAIQTIAQVLIKSEAVFQQVRPDAILLYGDTNSCLAVISAKKLKIPVFHMEAGNRCFDDRVPEEVNRRLVDHLSDINLPLTEHGRRYLLQEGLASDRVLKIGSCMYEVLQHNRPAIEKSDALAKLKLDHKSYFLVSCHREENVDTESNLTSLIQSLNHLAEEFGLPIIFSVHPRTQKRLDAIAEKVNLNALITALKPLGFIDYVRLQQSAFCVISDSGTLMEECSILGFPAVHCRDSFERPEGMEYGGFVMCPMGKIQMAQAVRMVTSNLSYPKPVPDYMISDVSKTVARIIATYTPIINRKLYHR